MIDVELKYVTGRWKRAHIRDGVVDPLASRLSCRAGVVPVVERRERGEI